MFRTNLFSETSGPEPADLVSGAERKGNGGADGRLCFEHKGFVLAIEQLAIQRYADTRQKPHFGIKGKRNKFAIVPDMAAYLAGCGGSGWILSSERLVHVNVLNLPIEGEVALEAICCSALNANRQPGDFGSAFQRSYPQRASVCVGHDNIQYRIVASILMCNVGRCVHVGLNVAAHVDRLILLFPQLLAHHCNREQHCTETSPAAEGSEPFSEAICFICTASDFTDGSVSQNPYEKTNQQEVGDGPSHKMGSVFLLIHALPLLSQVTAQVSETASSVQWGRA